MKLFIDALINPVDQIPLKFYQRCLMVKAKLEIREGIQLKESAEKRFKMIMDFSEIAKFTVGKLLQGDLWFNSTRVPYE